MSTDVQLLFRQVFTELLGHALEVLERNSAGVVIVEETRRDDERSISAHSMRLPKRLQDFLFRIFLGHLLRHQLKEVIEIDGPWRQRQRCEARSGASCHRPAFSL